MQIKFILIIGLKGIKWKKHSPIRGSFLTTETRSTQCPIPKAPSPSPMVIRNIVSSRKLKYVVKMCKELAGNDDILKTKVLIEINEDFHQADKINFALESTILHELVTLFSKDDSVIRELASRAIV